MSDKSEFLVLRVKRTRNPDAVGMTMIEASLDRLAKRGQALCFAV